MDARRQAQKDQPAMKMECARAKTVTMVTSVWNVQRHTWLMRTALVAVGTN